MSNRLFGATVAILAILVLAFGIPSIDSDTEFFSVGPKLFPSISASLMLALGVVIALQGSDETQLSILEEKDSFIYLLIVVGISLGFILLLTLVGFLISAFIALFTFLLVFGERRIKVVLPVAVGVPVVVYLTFLNAFALELPPGPIDFLFGGL